MVERTPASDHKLYPAMATLIAAVAPQEADAACGRGAVVARYRALFGSLDLAWLNLPVYACAAGANAVYD